MELSEAIYKRRSVRHFQNRPVEDEKIKMMIEAAIQAPSACNIQGWKFIIVDKQNLKDRIVDYGGSIVIKNAPVGILVLYDNRTKNYEYLDFIQSAAAAIQNIHLKAYELGLGTCWICQLPTKRSLRKIFNISRYYSPIAYILVGYPQFIPLEVPRKYSHSKVMAYNQFSQNWPAEKINPWLFIIKKILVKIYYLTPTFVKKIFLNKFIDKKFVKKFDN